MGISQLLAMLDDTRRVIGVSCKHQERWMTFRGTKRRQQEGYDTVCKASPDMLLKTGENRFKAFERPRPTMLKTLREIMHWFQLTQINTRIHCEMWLFFNISDPEDCMP